ncbi:MAG TPA: hypothetical protein PLK44_02655 [Aestuariivirga sp.]|nr:hypothetical protein [Aestuariivirga sp.]
MSDIFDPLPEEEASLFGLEIDGEILPGRQLAFKFAFIVEAFDPFAVTKPRQDNMFACGYSEFLIGSGLPIAGKAAWQQHGIIEQIAVDHQLDRDRHTLT